MKELTPEQIQENWEKLIKLIDDTFVDTDDNERHTKLREMYDYFEDRMSVAPASGKAHNLVINGAMNVAQRGTSSTSQGYQTIDRWRIDQDSGLTEACTQSQESIAYAAAPSPWASGFRKAFRITNGNQTSQDANDYIQLVQKIEAQDLAKSGWDYVSSSSNITLSFFKRTYSDYNFCRKNKFNR